MILYKYIFKVVFAILVLSEMSDMWELLVIKLPNHLPCHKMADQKCIIFDKKLILAHKNIK